MNETTIYGDGTNITPIPPVDEIHNTDIQIEINENEPSSPQPQYIINFQSNNNNNSNNNNPSSSTMADGTNANNNNRRRELPNRNLSSILTEARQTWGIQNVFQGPLAQNTYVSNLRTWMPRPSTFRYIPSINNANVVRSPASPNSVRNNNINIINNASPVDDDNFADSMNNNNNMNIIDIPELRPPQLGNRLLQERVMALQNNPQNNGNDDNTNGDENANVVDILAQVPEAREAVNMLVRYIPILCIIIVKSIYDHIQGIIDLFVLAAFFLHFNSVLRDQISKQSQRQILVLFREVNYILLFLILRLFFIDNYTFYGLLLFRPNLSLIYGEPITLSQLLFSVIVTDLLIKLITIVIKMNIAMMPHRCIKYKRRGRSYALCEAVSQLYRSLAPIQPWIVYLLDSYNGMEKSIGVIFSAAYMVAKCFDVYERMKFCKKIFTIFLKKVSYGREPTLEEINATGGTCPICHDNFATPVMLECNHIFCELCVGTWFTREATCPLCRAAVAEDPSWQDGATSFFVQLF